MDSLIVYDLLVILAGGLIAILVCRFLRVSSLVGYLLVGILIGDNGFGWVSDKHGEIAHLAEAGVFLLLFAIGLEFSLDELWRLRRSVLIGGSVQMLIVAAPVSSILWWFEMPWQSALLIGTATAFSSTVLVFKALEERGQSHLPRGRRAIAILLFQDAALIPLLLIVPLLTGASEGIGVIPLAKLLAVSTAFVAGIVILRYLLANHVVPLFASYRSLELIVLFTLVVLGGITLAAHRIGLPPAIGAFAAGLVLSGNRWTSQIDALMLPFRESFAAIFFVSLGLLFESEIIVSEPLFMFAMFVLLLSIKAFAATTALRLTGLKWREAAGMGIGLSHVGEFAFVLILLGVEFAVVSDTSYQRVIALAIGSLLLTPILLKSGLKWSQPSEEQNSDRVVYQAPPSLDHVVVVGAGPIGGKATSYLSRKGCDVCLVDFSPVNLNDFAQRGIKVVAGDAADDKVLEYADVGNARLVVVAIPDDDTALQIVASVKKLNRECLVVVRCRYQSNEQRLRKAGANQVVSEERQAGSALVEELQLVQMTCPL